jgi:hypothetical protein
MLLGTLMMGCAISPVVKSKQLSPHEYEIRIEADYTQIGSIFYDVARELCRNTIPWKLRPGIKLGSGRKATAVGTVECLKDGIWHKKNKGPLQIDEDRSKDNYECDRDAKMAVKMQGRSGSREFDIYYKHLYDQTEYALVFERCMDAKGYVFTDQKEVDEIKKKIDEILERHRRK